MGGKGSEGAGGLALEAVAIESPGQAAQRLSAEGGRGNGVVSRDEALEWIAGLFEEPVDNVQPGTPRDAIRAWDSLGMLVLMAGLDERFDINLDTDDLGSLKGVDDILAVLERHGKLS
jgi:acyl carrier protein